jgi:hypothetical protein
VLKEVQARFEIKMNELTDLAQLDHSLYMNQ